jgi:hypothetical protein
VKGYNWLDVAGFVVQCLLLGGLIWYALETWRIRLASQETIETLQKPCLAFSTAAREYNEALLSMDGAVGTMIVRCPEGQAQIENVGYGPAVNIRYALTPFVADSTRARPKGYLLGLRPGEKFRPPIPRGILQGNEWMCVLTYESLSGRRYRTNLTVNNLVLTSFKFGLDTVTA